jgi:hypothetical protein
MKIHTQAERQKAPVSNNDIGTTIGLWLSGSPTKESYCPEDSDKLSKIGWCVPFPIILAFLAAMMWVKPLVTEPHWGWVIAICTATLWTLFVLAVNRLLLHAVDTSPSRKRVFLIQFLRTVWGVGICLFLSFPIFVWLFQDDLKLTATMMSASPIELSATAPQKLSSPEAPISLTGDSNKGGDKSSLSDTLERQKTEQQTLKKEIERLKSKLEAQNNEYSQAKSTWQRNEGAYSSLPSWIKRLNAKAKTTQSELEKKEKELEKLDANIHKLQKAQDDLNLARTERETTTLNQEERARKLLQEGNSHRSAAVIEKAKENPSFWLNWLACTCVLSIFELLPTLAQIILGRSDAGRKTAANELRSQNKLRIKQYTEKLEGKYAKKEARRIHGIRCEELKSNAELEQEWRTDIRGTLRYLLVDELLENITNGERSFVQFARNNNDPRAENIAEDMHQRIYADVFAKFKKAS